MPTVECDYGDGLLKKKHACRDCKLYEGEDEGKKMMDILSEKRRKEYWNSVTDLLRLEGNISFEKHILLHKEEFLHFHKRKKEVHSQNSNNILLQLS